MKVFPAFPSWIWSSGYRGFFFPVCRPNRTYNNNNKEIQAKKIERFCSVKEWLSLYKFYIQNTSWFWFKFPSVQLWTFILWMQSSAFKCAEKRTKVFCGSESKQTSELTCKFHTSSCCRHHKRAIDKARHALTIQVSVFASQKLEDNGCFQKHLHVEESCFQVNSASLQLRNVITNTFLN